jgi:periplasmic protein TonB
LKDIPPAPPPVEMKEVDSKDIVFQRVEIESEFPGGQKAWTSFIGKNLNVDIAQKNGAKTRNYKVVVRFIVDKDGTLSDFVLDKNPGYGTGEEVIRMLKKSPKWKPAMQNGVVVKSIKTQPITFMVD